MYYIQLQNLNKYFFPFSLDIFKEISSLKSWILISSKLFFFLLIFRTTQHQHLVWLKFRMVSRNLVHFRFLCKRVSRFFDFHVINFFLANFKIFSRFQTKKNFSHTWEHSGAKNMNVNIFFCQNFCWHSFVIYELKNPRLTMDRFQKLMGTK